MCREPIDTVGSGIRTAQDWSTTRGWGTNTTCLSRSPAVVSGLSFYSCLSIFHLFSWVSAILSEFNERNSTKSCHMFEVNAIWKCMSKIWGISFPLKSGAQKPPIFDVFRRLRNLTGRQPNVFGTYVTWHSKLGFKRWKLQRVSYIFAKFHEPQSTNGWK